MVNDKCIKCGTKIPKEARFCPSCGAEKVVATPPPAQPQPVQQPVQPQQMPPQQMRAPARPIHEAFGPLFSKNLIIIGVLLGILLAWIGEIIARFTTFTTSTVGFILNSLGFVFMGLFLTGGGILNKNFDNFVRIGLIIAGAIVLGMGITI